MPREFVNPASLGALIVCAGPDKFVSLRELFGFFAIRRPAPLPTYIYVLMSGVCLGVFETHPV